MTTRASISRRLAIGLSIVGTVGTLLLLATVVIEYRLAFDDLANDEAFRRALREVGEHVVLPVIVLIFPMAAAGQWVIRKGLAPLEEAARQIEATRGRERGFRIDASSLPAEILPFADAINNLLLRLDGAAAQHEAFAADVAHELRTPLAVLSLELDNLQHEEAQRLKAEVVAMRRLVDQLMLLAQVDAERAAHLPPTDISLGDVAGDVISLLAPSAIAAGKTLALEDMGGGTVKGRREAVAAALRNLVENGLRVTPAGGQVLVIAGPDGSFRVRDGGPGLTPERLASLALRHNRADHASVSGAGLGLAIVSRIMAAHGGRLATNPAHRELQLHFPG